MGLVLLIVGLLLFLLVANPAVHIIGLVLLIVGAALLVAGLVGYGPGVAPWGGAWGPRR